MGSRSKWRASDLLVLMVLAIPCAASHTPTASAIFELWRNETRGNPFKGFLTSPSWGDTSAFDSSLEFHYVPLKDLMQSLSSFTFAAGMEPLLNGTRSRGKHAIVRVWLDYPGSPTGVPAALASQISFNAYTDYGGGNSPDYGSAVLYTWLEAFVAEFGRRYDGDARIAVIQIGLLGFWGEWHTYRDSCSCDTWFPGETNQRRVLSAFDAAFNRTKLVVRIPNDVTVTYDVGFHDDSFAQSTVGPVDWFFASQIAATPGAAQRYRTQFVGGELRPELQATIFSPSYVVGTYSQDFAVCVRATKASWLLNAHAFSPRYTGADLARAVDASLSLGYEFHVASARFDAASGALDSVAVNVSIENTGVAPFYYPLSVALRYCGNARSVLLGASVGSPAYDVRLLMPNVTVAVVAVVNMSACDDATVRVVLVTGTPFDGVVVRFANQYASARGGALEWTPVATCKKSGSLFVSGYCASSSLAPSASGQPSATPSASAGAGTNVVGGWNAAPSTSPHARHVIALVALACALLSAAVR